MATGEDTRRTITSNKMTNFFGLNAVGNIRDTRYTTKFSFSDTLMQKCYILYL